MGLRSMAGNTGGIKTGREQDLLFRHPGMQPTAQLSFSSPLLLWVPKERKGTISAAPGGLTCHPRERCGWRKEPHPRPWGSAELRWSHPRSQGRGETGGVRKLGALAAQWILIFLLRTWRSF